MIHIPYYFEMKHFYIDSFTSTNENFSEKNAQQDIKPLKKIYDAVISSRRSCRLRFRSHVEKTRNLFRCKNPRSAVIHKTDRDATQQLFLLQLPIVKYACSSLGTVHTWWDRFIDFLILYFTLISRVGRLFWGWWLYYFDWEWSDAKYLDPYCYASKNNK